MSSSTAVPGDAASAGLRFRQMENGGSRCSDPASKIPWLLATGQCRASHRVRTLARGLALGCRIPLPDFFAMPRSAPFRLGFSIWRPGVSCTRGSTAGSKIRHFWMSGPSVRTCASWLRRKLFTLPMEVSNGSQRTGDRRYRKLHDRVVGFMSEEQFRHVDSEAPSWKKAPTTLIEGASRRTLTAFGIDLREDRQWIAFAPTHRIQQTNLAPGFQGLA